ILAAILFPVFGAAKEQGKLASCQGNLKQIGTAIDLYVGDNAGRYPCATRVVPSAVKLNAEQYPNNVTWDIAIFKYVKSIGVLKCPSDGKARPKHRYVLRNIIPHARSYSYNDPVCYNTWATRKVSSHPDTWTEGEIRYSRSKCVSLTEFHGAMGEDIENPGVVNASAYAYNDFGWPSCCTLGGQQPKLGVHQNAAVVNYLFLDGHVKGMDPEKMKKSVEVDKTIYYDYLRLTVH
ncbi:hypothetical protein LLG39_01780, partial [bacterium]|nr:hypothetical protein [bacterium]